MPFPAGSLLFVADVHLGPSAPKRTAAFLEFLAELSRPPRPAGLYVLGDLFDLWLGRGSLLDGRHAAVIAGLSSLARSGVPVTVFQGNRDFLLDARFGERSGATVVEEGLTVFLGPRRAFLCHGDRLLLRDRAHQRMRWILRSVPGRALAAALPPRAIQTTAQWLRHKSDAAGARRQPDLSSIPPEAAARIFRGGYGVIITGHVHKARHRLLRVDGRTCELYTLGAWDERGSVLVFDGNGFEFWPFPLDLVPPAPSSPEALRALRAS